MDTNTNLKKKDEEEVALKVTQILRVQELIDFFVLSEILEEPKYVKEITKSLRTTLGSGGIGVNMSYMSKRIDYMTSQGYITRYWNNDHKRHEHYCRITEEGVTYLKMMLKDMPNKVEKAISFYTSLNKYMGKFKHWDLSE